MYNISLICCGWLGVIL